MKKVLLSITLFAIVSFSFGQLKAELGIKGGVNLSSLSGNDVGENITAYHGGAYVMAKFTKLAVQAEGLFSKRGSERIDLDYLDVPLIFKIYLAAGLNLQAGPQFGILLSKNATDGLGNSINQYIENSDISATVGAGWDLPFGLNLTARYLIGLKDVNTQPDTAEIKNNTFQLSIGYQLFKLGR